MIHTNLRINFLSPTNTGIFLCTRLTDVPTAKRRRCGQRIGRCVVMYDAPLFLFITTQIGSFSLSRDLLKISLIHVFPASKNSSCKLIKQSNQPIHTLFSHFCTHLLYIEGNGKESKVHEDLVLPKMSETFVVHIVFNLPEHGFRFYASLSSVLQPFLGAEQLPDLLLVFPKPVIQFYRPVPFCLKTTAS